MRLDLTTNTNAMTKNSTFTLLATKIELIESTAESAPGTGEWFICPHCRGNGHHLEWCPWLVRAGGYPEKVSTLKFTCQYCGGIKCHQPKCSWFFNLSRKLK